PRASTRGAGRRSSPFARAFARSLLPICGVTEVRIEGTVPGFDPNKAARARIVKERAEPGGFRGYEYVDEDFRFARADRNARYHTNDRVVTCGSGATAKSCVQGHLCSARFLPEIATMNFETLTLKSNWADPIVQRPDVVRAGKLHIPDVP